MTSELFLVGGLVAGTVVGARTVVASWRAASPPALTTVQRQGVTPGVDASGEEAASAELPRGVSDPRAVGGLRTVPSITPEQTPGGLFGGVRDELLLDRIRRGTITSIKFNRGGSSISFRLTFADGSRAACKPDQTNLQTVPRKELAAYRINRLLGLSGVPPAAARWLTWREIEEKLHPESRVFLSRIKAETLFDEEGKTGTVVSHWIPMIVDAHLEKEQIPLWEPWLRLGSPMPRGRHDFVRQLSGMLVLDLLTSNYDRFTGTNDFMSPDGRRLYYMDNTIGFYLEPEGHLRPRGHFLRAHRFSRRLYDRLRAFTEERLRAELAQEPDPPWPILTDQEIAAVMSRRNFALRRINRLIAAYGRARVLCFP